MPQIRYYTVDIHVQARVSGIGDDGGELTHAEALRQAARSLQSTPSLRHGLQIVSATVTETSIGGRPLTSLPGKTMPDDIPHYAPSTQDTVHGDKGLSDG